jgi:hypothetical protein
MLKGAGAAVDCDAMAADMWHGNHERCYTFSLGRDK